MCNIGAYRGLNNFNRVPLKGSFKGYHKGTIRV